MKRKQIVTIGIIAVLIFGIIASLLISRFGKIEQSVKTLDLEILKSENYKEITDEDSNIDNCEYVKFSAFFTRDLDGDGKAEKLLGVCRNVTDTDILYMDINVQTNGYLEDGKITINNTNFNYSMNMVKDNVLKNNYISNNVNVIDLNQVNAGTQKLIIGNVLANIGNDTNNYSKISSITLTGTHVSDEGIKTPINKEIDLTVDWHGTTYASLNRKNFYYNYDDLQSETISFDVGINETQRQLILKENVVTVTIPELNGYAPIDVKCSSSNVESEYSEDTRILKLKRNSTINENGIITNTLPYNNTYTISVTYPKEAYELISSYTELKVPVLGYYTGYNNEEFKNPYQSNIANGNITVVFRETPKGSIYNFYVDFMDKKTVQKPIHRSVISKQDILNLYDSEEEVKNKEYIVRWRAVRGTEGQVPSMIMSETKENEVYGDKWDNTIMQDYIVNTGIYFSGADQILGSNGTITVYNNDTNEIIKEFTKDEWNEYSKENPYKYENSVKHIRIQTSKANLNSDLNVYNVKELDINKILQDFTKNEIKDINLIYTYLTGICNIEGQEAGTVKDIDSAYFTSETSDAKISMQNTKLSTQETLRYQRIYIDTVANQTDDAKWKNGEFLVEIPEEIINIKINNVTINNSDVKIVAYDLFQKDGKYFIKIITENENPITYKITIDCDITPDPRMPSKGASLKLYAYNENCNSYYYNTQDSYDVNGNNNIDENVGTHSVKFNLLSPTSLITLETISDYNEKNEITIAPNVAEVSKEKRQAKINLSITNNYTNTVSGIQILGKIPYEGNTYILNGKSLGSKFSTTMTSSGITLPEELEQKAVVYYSSNEQAGKDVKDVNNGWTLKENVQDFSKIKTYLIVLNEYEIEKGKEYLFNYNINIPEGIGYNLTSYSTHSVYYELNTDGGNLSLSTEPNKVGVRIARKISLELTKYKINSELKIPGVTYSLKYDEENEDGKQVQTTKILTTDSNGKISLDNIYVNKKYILQEIKAPISCELNSEEINFEILEGTNGEISVQINSGNVKRAEILNNDTLNIEIEDEVRYKLDIEKLDENNNKLNGIKYRITGKEIGLNGSNKRICTTNDDGKISIQGVYVNETYKLEEIEAKEQYYLDPNKNNAIEFRIERNNETNKLELKIWNVGNGIKQIGQQTFADSKDMVEPVLSVKLQNNKIPTYSLEIVKVNKEGELLKNASFMLTSKDTAKKTTRLTDENGKIYINNLFECVDGKYITGEYILEEIIAPEGYAATSSKLTFRCKRDLNNNLVMQIIDGVDLIQEIELEDSNNIYSINDEKIENRNVKIENDKLIITVENAPKFKLTKRDEETKSLLPNAKFRVSDFNDNKVLGIDGREIGNKETTNIDNWTSTTTYKWTKNEDGTYKSGNQSVNSTTSTIKFDFKLDATRNFKF